MPPSVLEHQANTGDQRIETVRRSLNDVDGQAVVKVRINGRDVEINKYSFTIDDDGTIVIYDPSA
jgi:hypothetical protein